MNHIKVFFSICVLSQFCFIKILGSDPTYFDIAFFLGNKDHLSPVESEDQRRNPEGLLKKRNYLFQQIPEIQKSAAFHFVKVAARKLLEGTAALLH